MVAAANVSAGQAADVPVHVSATSHVPAGGRQVVGGGAEELAGRVPKGRVVAAFQTVPSEVLFGVFDARRRKARAAPSIFSAVSSS